MSSNITKLKLIGYFKGTAFFVPILTLYLLNHNIGLAEIVFTQTIYAIFVFLGEVPTGILGDKFGQKVSIMLGYFLNVVGASFLIFMPSTLGIYIAYAIIGFADSCLSGSEEALFFESFKRQNSLSDNYKKHFSIFTSNEMIGVVVSTLFAGLLVQIFKEAAFVPLIVMNVLARFIAFLIACSLKDVKVEIPDQSKGAHAFTILKEAMLHIRNNKIIFTLTAVMVLTLSGEYFVYSVYQPYFEQHNVPAVFLGIVLSAGAALNFFLIRYAYLMEKYLPFEKIILLVNVCLGLLYIGLALIVNPIFLVAGVILLRGIFNIQNPIVSDYVNEYVPSHIRTTVLSGMSQIRYLFQIGTRTILALLVGSIGIQKTFFIQGLYLLVGITISYWLLTKCGCVNKITKHYE
jgi:MFS family permease